MYHTGSIILHISIKYYGIITQVLAPFYGQPGIPAIQRQPALLPLLVVPIHAPEISQALLRATSTIEEPQLHHDINLPADDEAAVVSCELRAVEGLEHLYLLVDALQFIFGRLKFDHLRNKHMPAPAAHQHQHQRGRNNRISSNIIGTLDHLKKNISTNNPPASAPALN